MMKKIVLGFLFIFTICIQLHAEDDSLVSEGKVNLEQSDLMDRLNYNPKKIKENSSGEVEIEELQPVTTPLVEYIIDSSGSMGQAMGKDKSKIYVLKKLVSKYLVSQWSEKTSSGLRLIGSRREKDCEDNYLAITPGQSNLEKIETIVKDITPKGKTPLGSSLRDAYKDLEHYQGPKRVVVFTDGEETCGEDPCKIAEELGKKAVDLKFFIVAFGLKNQGDILNKLQCVGDMSQADSEEELEGLLQDLNKSLNPQKNLFVESPDPNATVFLFKANSPNELYRRFSASMGIKVPPGKYIAIVNLSPKYKFAEFEIKPTKRVTLKVKGEGRFVGNFKEKLIKIEILDKNRKVVKQFTSDKPTSIPIGRWAVRFFKTPFFEKIVEDYLIAPNGEYIYDIVEAGAVIIDDPKVRGIYILNLKGETLGNFLTNVPLVLPKGVYEFRVENKCVFRDISLGGGKNLVRLDCSKADK
jgi:hypothetical protein